MKRLLLVGGLFFAVSYSWATDIVVPGFEVSSYHASAIAAAGVVGNSNDSKDPAVAAQAAVELSGLEGALAFAQGTFQDTNADTSVNAPLGEVSGNAQVSFNLANLNQSDTATHYLALTYALNGKFQFVPYSENSKALIGFDVSHSVASDAGAPNFERLSDSSTVQFKDNLWVSSADNPIYTLMQYNENTWVVTGQVTVYLDVNQSGGMYFQTDSSCTVLYGGECHEDFQASLISIADEPVSTVPEASTMSLLVVGLVALLFSKFDRKMFAQLFAHRRFNSAVAVPSS